MISDAEIEKDLEDNELLQESEPSEEELEEPEEEPAEKELDLEDEDLEEPGAAGEPQDLDHDKELRTLYPSMQGPEFNRKTW